MKKDKSYVVIGGGTGTFSVLSGLKKYTENITAVVSMADSGGSAKKERDEWGLLPSSDIRKSLLALADVSAKDSLILRRLFEYRFAKGIGLSGMTFGNLFLVALSNITKSQLKAIELASELLRIKGKVLPVSLDKVDLTATYSDGSIVTGEHNIDDPVHNGKLKIVKLSTVPEATVSPHVLHTIEDSDVLIIGPGGFYTTIIANLVVKGVSAAIKKSHAKKIFIINIMTEYGQTYNFTAKTFIQELGKYMDISKLNYVLLNNAPIPDYILKRYQKSQAIPVINDLKGKFPFKIISADLLSQKKIKREKGDILKRSLIRHDPDKIARICLKLN
ncbi:hypothetical protein A2W14_00505 [Candidatus Gottesmanbacteria bacterium RBG_16_37_8]|uniref:Gluconeogenesis factor n=1 Tax=Candidatus Gottesmanbacteria bacterium RBG_16_37_8 TaxID=1798371 RepID=A0A1F5YR61_9BACT|nr:MAG: hypothetical protein A2W14_00505 [Candidatus Gottesmanbacteria bacterium RBG_16_37_8]